MWCELHEDNARCRGGCQGKGIPGSGSIFKLSHYRIPGKGIPGKVFHFARVCAFHSFHVRAKHTYRRFWRANSASMFERQHTRMALGLPTAMATLVVTAR
jgi:hypothetical protein